MSEWKSRTILAGVIGAVVALAPHVSAQDLDPASDPLAGLPTVTLEDCVTAALKNGPAVQSAQLALEQAGAVFAQTRAKQGLSVGESVGYSHVGSSQSNPVALSSASAASGAGNAFASGENIKGGIALNSPDSSLGLSAVQSVPPNATDRVTPFGLSGNQVLWDGYWGGISSANVKIAENTYAIAKLNEQAAIKTATLQTQQTYYTLLSDQRTLTVRKATLQTAQSNLLQEQSLFQAQRATALDVLQVQVALRQAQLDGAKALNQVATDRKTLSIDAGWDLDKSYQVSDEPPPTPGASTAEAAVAIALTHRSELGISEANLASAQINLQVQKASGSPVVSLTGSLAVGQDWTNSTSTQNFSVGANVALPPVYDGGFNSGLVRQASAQFSADSIQKNQLRQTITVAVQNDLFTVRDAKDRLDLAQTSVEAAQGEYDLEKAKLSVGLETIPNVLTAFTNLVTAQVGLETAKSTYVLAILQLNNDLGL